MLIVALFLLTNFFPESVVCQCGGTPLYINLTTTITNFTSPNYPSDYPSDLFCRWYITAPTNFAVEAFFNNGTYYIENNIYCSYDYVIFYDGNSTTDSMLNKFCGYRRPEYSYRSSGEQMLIVFRSDYILEYGGFNISVNAVSNQYPDCKVGYPEYSASYNRDEIYIFNNYTYIENISFPENFGFAYYDFFVEQFWLFTSSNTTHYKMVIDILSLDIERAYTCLYDKLILYDGPCISNGALYVTCGTWARRWDLDGPEYLLHFHSDGYKSRPGFQLIYYAELKSVAAPATTTTTTLGPPVGAVVEAVKSLLTNYSNENLPTRDLSVAITASIDFYLVGINGLDEVEQKMTSTGQFEVTWIDSSLAWDPTKRQGVVQVLLPQNDVWKPDIALINGFTSISAMGAKFMFINVDYNGSCIWKPYQIMESVCKVDMTHYPYDRQTCVLKFGTWSTDDSEVVTELGAQGLQIHPNFQENSEWRLITTETRQEDNDHHKVVEFFLTLERNPRYVTFYMTMPVIVLAYMNVFTFVIPSESGEKTGYSITIFLSFVVLLIINNDAMPENSDTISLYAAFLLTMTIMSAIALIVSVLQIRALTFTERRYRIPNCVKTFVKFIIKFQSVVSCSGKKSDSDIGSENGDSYDERELLESAASERVVESPMPIKKVKFKDEDENENDNDDNGRFTLPRRTPMKTSFKPDRENTLFETNTLIRSSTALSLAEDTKQRNKINDEGDSAIKTPKNEDDKKQHDGNEKIAEPRRETSNIEREVDPNNTAKQTEPMSSVQKMTELKPSNEEQTTPLTSTYFDSPFNRNKKVVHFEIDEKGPSPSSSADLYGSSSKHDEHSGSTIMTVFPTPALEKQDDQDIANDEDVNNGQEKVIPNKNAQVKSTGISVSESNATDENTLATDSIGLSSNVLSAIENAMSSQTGSNAQESAQKESSLQQLNETGNSSEQNLAVTTGNPSGPIADDLVTNHATSAHDVKMQRPPSTTESRPVSVNRLFSSSGNRVVLSDHGRALSAGKGRALSRNSERAVSRLGRASVTFNTDRPVSRSKPDDSTVLLFGAEDNDDIMSAEEDDAETTSVKSAEDSIAESSEISCVVSEATEENELSWTDLAASTDVLFFIVYLFITTLMTMAMFFTMIHAY